MPRSSLPAPVARDVRRLGVQLGDPRVRVSAYRWTRSAAQRRLGAPDTGGDDAPILFVTFRGHLAYRKARTAKKDKTVRGRFAFVTYSAPDGEPLDFGVFPDPPTL